MTSSLGRNGRFWPYNEDLHWCWFSPHGVSRVYYVSILNVACNVYFLAYCYILLLIIILKKSTTSSVVEMVSLGIVTIEPG